MGLSKQEKRLLTELNVRYECVIADVSLLSEAQRFTDQQLGDIIKQQCELERECFAQKHKISSIDIKQMENAYAQLDDLD